jgi:Predicted transcriptional regulators
MAKPKSRLEYLRKINFMTQAEVAAALAITQSHYNKIERGDRGLSMNMARKLKALFKVDYIDDLLDEHVAVS